MLWRRKQIIATAAAAILAALGLILIIRFLVPKTLDEADKWAGVLALLLAYVVSAAGLVVWIARRTRPATIATGLASAAPDREELLAKLHRASLVRTRDAWRGLGLSADAVQRLEELVPDDLGLELPTHGAVLVTGELGAGKSFFAEQLHRQHIDVLIRSGQGRWPCILFAQDLENTDLAVVVEASGPKNWSGGYWVLVDGCDEIPRDDGARLLREAHFLAGMNDETLIVLFSRPGYLTSTDEFSLPPISKTFTEQLMSAVAGRDVAINHISTEVEATIRRPLFAILYARSDFRTLRSMTTGGLLAAMVEDVLLRDRATSDQLFSALRSLASQTTLRRGTLPVAEVGGLDRRENLIATRLVVVRGSTIRFASPVIEQYFAAQALLQGEINISAQLASLRGWELWRLAWVMAVATGGWEDTSRLITALVRSFPGAAAWLVHQALPDPNHIESQGGEALDNYVVEQRLQRALDTWCAAFPQITSFSTQETSVPKLVVRKYDNGDTFLGAWTGSRQPTEEQIAEGMRLFERVDGWWARGTIRPGNHPAWPWQTTLTVLGHMISYAIKKLAKNAAAPSLHDEQMWAAAKHLAPAHLRYQLHGQGDRTKLREAILAEIDHHIARVREDNPVRYSVNGREFQLEDLAALKEYMLAAPGVVNDPWPGANHPSFRSDWSGYDMQRLIARATAVYSAAFDAYSHVVSKWLPQLTDTLELAILLPVRMTAYVDVDNHGPGISLELWPLPTSSRNEFRIAAGKAPPQPWEETKREYRRFARDVDQYRPESAAWVHSFGGLFALEIFGDRPATALAFKWLWGDLTELHLVERPTPTFTF